MNIKKQLFGLVFALFLGFFLTGIQVDAAVLAPAKAQPQAQYVNAISVTPLQVVANPSKYLNKTVRMNATFDKFSTLGLDYKKAMRSSQDYIGFLIQRDDVSDHNIPLSEMKLFLNRKYAEKFIDLDTGDKIQITGKVFSCALGDSWVDVNKIVITKKVNPPKSKDKK